MALPDDLSADLPPSPTAEPTGEPRSEVGITVVPVPIPPPPVESGKSGGRARIVVMGGLLAVLGFLLGSFPARNSDLWGHLARGRLLMEGNSPATASAQVGSPTTATTWIADVVAYGLYQLGQGSALIVVKAGLIALLAFVLFHLALSGDDVGVAGVCAILAILAMSTRLLLQPITLGFLFFALALWLRQRTGTPLRWLLCLFLVWANTSSWLLLGLVLVGLAELGQAIDEVRKPSDKRKPLLGRVGGLALMVGVGLLNPVHAWALLPPSELQWMFGFGETGAPSGARLVTSPFQEAYFSGPGLNPAGMAYFPLLILGILSFLLNRRNWSWERFFPWAALAGLSAVEVRAIPFFAIVAGPALAANWRELLDQSYPSRRNLSPQGSGLILVVGALLLVCAWPGWLQAPPFEPRRWEIETSPALERGAAALQRWYADARLERDAVGLHLSPEAAPAFAWFCPNARSVRDPELAAALRGETKSPDDVTSRMRDQGISHVIVYESERNRLLFQMERFLRDETQWPLLFVEGGVAIFGWRDPGRPAGPDRYRDLTWNAEQRAYHPSADRRVPSGPVGEDPRAWWEALWKPAPRRTVDRDEAAVHLNQAVIHASRAPDRHLEAWNGTQAASLIVLSGPGSAPGALVQATLGLVMLQPQLPTPTIRLEQLPALDRMVLGLQPRFSWQREESSPALLTLTIRAARRALFNNPEDAGSWVVLADAYLRQMTETRERVWTERMPELAQLRRAQASWALHQAIALRPDLAEVHFKLASHYRRLGYFDLGLTHLRHYRDLLRKSGPPAGMTVEQFQQGQTRLQEDLDRLARDVETRENELALAAAKMRVFDRALMAYEKGLAGRACDLLLESDVAAFGSRGMALELELLLRSGRAQKARDWTSPDQKAALGGAPYHWIRAQAYAAIGDYAEAATECSELSRTLSIGDADERDAVRPAEVMALLTGQEVLDQQPGHSNVLSLLWRASRRGDYRQRIVSLGRTLRQEADAHVLRGILLTEAGQVEEAEVAFRVALTLWGSDAAVATGAGLDFNGRIVAQTYLQWLE